MEPVRAYLHEHMTPNTIKIILLFFITISITFAVCITLYILFKEYEKRKNKFAVSFETNRFIAQQKDNLSKWIENTEKRIKKNNLKIKAKRYILVSVLAFIAAFTFSVRIFSNLTASILFSAIAFIIPEYLISLYEDSVVKKVEEQMVSAIKLYTSEFMQKKSMQKIFATISTKVKDPIGKYFADAYYEIITGTPIDMVLSKLSGSFNTIYGKMFVQLIHQSQKDSSVINLLPELLIKLENHIELTRSNKTSIAGDRLQAFIISLLPIPAYFGMSRYFPETQIFIRETYYGRLIITLSFLSVFVFIMLDRFIRRVE